MWRKRSRVRSRRSCRSRVYRPAVLLLEDRSVPSFLGPASYTVPGGAGDVAVGDFTGNGIADLAVLNPRGGSVSILLGRGDGTFRDAVSYAVGVNPNFVVVGDFNGDGIPDLAISSYSYTSTDTVRILLGNGDGTFQPPASYVCGARPVGLVAGDFNGDGVLDLAVANEDGIGPDYRGSVHVLLGNGDGSFQTPVTYAAGIIPRALVEGDFRGDGILDLAVANVGIGTAGTGSSISVLKGVGDGSFLPAVDNAPGLPAQSLAVGDLTGGGLPDLLVGRAASTLVTVLRNRGDGSFVAAGDFAAGGDPSAIVVGDFTGHGVPDLAVANNLRETLSILPGNSDGTFGSPLSYAAGYVPGRLATGDFNGDGAPDLVLTNTLSDSVSVFLNRGDGTFQASVEMSAGANPNSVVAADFNGDDFPDLAVASSSSSVTPGTVNIFLGNGNGTFQPPVGYQVGVAPDALAVGDFNGDGIPDIAVANNGPPGSQGTVSILLGRGDGTFLPAVGYAVGGDPRALVVGDFNGDGIPDIATANYLSGTVSVLLGRGDGTFAPAITAAAGDVPLALAAGDFTGDGRLDLVTVNQGPFPDYTGTVHVLLGNGDGTFRPPITFSTGTTVRYAAVAAADLNGDGLAGLAVVGGGTSIFLSNGDGTFRQAGSYPVGAFAVTMGDFKGDGVPDLAVAGANPISILPGNGDGTFGPALNYLGGHRPGSLAVGDFNGDGFPDLAAVNASGVIVLFNAGDRNRGAADIGSRGRTRARTPTLHLRAPAPAWAVVSSAPLVNHDQQIVTQQVPAPDDSRLPLPALTATVPEQAVQPHAGSAVLPSAARLDEAAALPAWADSLVDWPDGSRTPLP